MTEMRSACFIGMGYIGLPTAAVLAQSSLQVYGFDVNKQVIDTINSGAPHILEKGLDDLVKEVVTSGKLQVFETPQKSDVYIIVVPTPFNSNKEPDLTFVMSAAERITPLLEEGNLVIIESTSPVGTTRRVANHIGGLRPELKDVVSFAYCPERVLPGNIIHELVHNDRVVGGLDDKASELARSFYTHFVQGEIHVTTAETAELCKLVENASRDVQIAFANELSLICAKTDINVWELIELANRHPRVNILQPGSGVGGHCIAVDPYFITSEFPKEAQIIARAREINNYKAFWCAEQIREAMLSFEKEHGRNPQVALMGLAFKPNIDDLRESPAKYIAQKVIQSEQDGVMITEPNIKDHSFFKLHDYREAYEKADIVAFLVAHDQFKSLERRADKRILDFCGIFK